MQLSAMCITHSIEWNKQHEQRTNYIQFDDENVKDTKGISDEAKYEVDI